MQHKLSLQNSFDLTSLPAFTSLCATSDAKCAARRTSAFAPVILLSYNHITNSVISTINDLKRATRKGHVNNHIAEHHSRTLLTYKPHY